MNLRVVMLGIALLLASLPAFASEVPQLAQGRFPLLSRLAADGTPPALTEAERGELLDEVAVERLLWHDELGRLRERAAGSAEALTRIDRVHDEVMQKLEGIEESVKRGELDAQELRRVLSAGADQEARPRHPVISGGGLRLPEPVHREVTLQEDLPPAYWEEPSAEYESFRPKAAGEDDAVNLLAASLSSDPVALYQHVLHEITPVNAYGLSRSPEAVLASGQGTGADQAALLAALFRASGFPARVVWGVQELSTWALGEHFGLEGPQLENALTTGGYAWSPVVKAGQVVAYRISRIWCEAWIPFVDFRGVMLGQGGATWIPMDAWIKGANPWGDRRILEEMDLDSQDFRQRFLSGEFCQGDLNQPGACPSLEEALTAEVETYLADHGEILTFDELATGRPSNLRVEQFLAPTMVGRDVSVDGYGIELPEDLRFRVQLQARDGATVLMDVGLDVADLSAGEAVIWYEPASDADADVVEALGGYLWDVPPYLVNVTPVLMVGQDVIARGEPNLGLGMGQAFDLELTITTPAGASWTWSNSQLAGVPVGLGIAAGRQGYETPYEEPASTIQLLSKLATTYLDDVVAFEEKLGAIDQMILVHHMPSVVAVSSVIEPEGSLGMVTDLEFLGIQIDADLWGSDVAGGDTQARKRWRQLARLNASTLERKLFEDFGITSVSADLALILAESQGTQILHIDQGNLASALAQLPYDQNIESEIEAWVLSGGEADVPVALLEFIEWGGVGYVLTDPTTGEGKYQLAGSLSGGMTVLPPTADAFLLLAVPPWPPLSTPVVRDPNAAAVLEVRLGFDGQIGRAGSEAGVYSGSDPVTVPLLAEVRTRDARPVMGVLVRFEIVAGEGFFLDEDEQHVTRIWIPTDDRGWARARFVFDPKTATVPYYGVLEDDDWYPTRFGANLIRVTTAPVGLEQTIWAFSAPGPLHSAFAERTQWSTVPNMLAGRAKVTALDQGDNPIANAFVTASLSPADGAVLRYEEFETYVAANIGTLLLGDITDPTPVIEGELTRGDGKMACYVVLGNSGPSLLDITVIQGAISKSGTVDFSSEVPDDGEILYSWSARPTGSQGQWIEAYAPGGEIVRPLVLDLFRAQAGVPVRAPRDQVRAIFNLVAGCPTGSALMATPDPQQIGGWATGLKLGLNPGECWLIAAVEEFQQGAWQPVLFTEPSATVWAVSAQLDTPLPVVTVGLNGKPTERREFGYSILPGNYLPAWTDVLFKEGGKVIGLAHAFGAGDGHFSLEANSTPFSAQKQHSAQLVLNLGKKWWPATDGRPTLELRGTDEELVVVGVGIKAAFKIIEHETEMKTEVDTGTGDQFYRALGGMRIKLWTEESTLAEEYGWNSTGGEFFEDQYSATALSGADLERREIWWAPPPQVGQTWPLTLSVRARRPGGGLATYSYTMAFVTRLLEFKALPDPPMSGDDVEMLQRFLWVIGVSEAPRGNANYGVYAVPVTINRQFTALTETAVERFQRRDEVGIDGRVGIDTLGKVVAHWIDYLDAYGFFHTMGRDEYINTDHPDFPAWTVPAADILQDPLQGGYPQASLLVSAEDLITAWVKKETDPVGVGPGHWGWNGRNFRVTLGSFDPVGSIGFSQIWNEYQYGSPPLGGDLADLNLYDPVDAVVAIATFSARRQKPGGGFYRAFNPASSCVPGRTYYQASKDYASAGIWPRIGSAYTDDELDLLSKGVMVYNGSYPNTGSETWPELLKLEVPVNNGRKIDYALQILHGPQGSGFGPRCWQWEDRVITTGANDICDSAANVDPGDVTVPVVQGVNHQVCVEARDGGNLQTARLGNDEMKTFPFQYCVSDWMRGTSWSLKRSKSRPSVIP